MSKHGGVRSVAVGGASKTTSEMPLETIQEVHHRNGRALLDEQRRLMAWMRRHTPLSDDEILAALKDYSTAAFNAGHEIGWTEAMHEARWGRRHVRILGACVFVLTAALVAAFWFMFPKLLG